MFDPANSDAETKPGENRVPLYEWVLAGDHSYIRLTHETKPQQEEQLIDMEYFRTNDIKVSVIPFTEEELEIEMKQGESGVVFVSSEDTYIVQQCEENEIGEIKGDDMKVTHDAVTFQVFDPPDMKFDVKPDTLQELDQDQKPQLEFDDIELVDVKPEQKLLPTGVRKGGRKAKKYVPKKGQKRCTVEQGESATTTTSQMVKHSVVAFPMQVSKCSPKQCSSVESCSIFTNNPNFTTEDEKDEDEKHVPKKKLKTDRYAFYTDGKTCWHPPLQVFKQSCHPIPNLERPSQKFRFYHQQLLRELVKESIIRQAHSTTYSFFEQKCLHLGITQREVEQFRSFDYNIELIREAWFGKYRLKEKSETERIKWLQMAPVLQQLLTDMESKVASFSAAFVEDKLRDPEVKIDWLFVSAQMLLRGSRNVSPEACERLWNNVLSPNIVLPHRWTQQDFSKLKLLTTKPGKLNFQKIAKEMGKGFTSFLCMKIFVKYITPTVEERIDNTEELRALWNQEAVQSDFRMTMEMYNGSFRCTAQWMSFAYGVEFPEQFLIQQCEKYKIGQFSLAEDCILIVTDEIIREHNLVHYTFRDFLPWRPESAWDHRLFALRYPHMAATGGKNNWTEDEDRLLLRWAKKSKRGWTGIKKYFHSPRRSRKALQARYMILLYKLRRQSLEEFHSKRLEPLSSPFYYMRKSLCYLEEIEEYHREIDSISTPDPVLVRNLFRDFHDQYNKRQKFSLDSSNDSKQFPQQRHLLSFLLQMPSYYVQEAIDKMRRFLTEVGINPTLPP